MHARRKTVSAYRRIGAAAMCLTLLLGTVMGLWSVPVTANSAAVKNFDVDFGDLTGLVDSSVFGDKDPEAGDEGLDVDVPVTGLTYQRYTPTEEDAAVNEWMSARFAMWANREKNFYGEKKYVGESSDALDGGDSYAGASNWAIGHDGALSYAYTGKLGDQMLRKSATLTVKAENGMMAKLSNFEATIVFNEAYKGERGAVFLLFHEERPGQLNTKNFGQKFVGKNAAVIVGNDGSKDGILIRDFGADVASNTLTAFSSNLKNGKDHTLYVKVVGTVLTVKVLDAAGTELYTKETTVKAGSGYLSIGVANSDRNLKSIKVTELDENGQPVDFGTKTGTAYDTFDFTVTDLIPFKKAENIGNTSSLGGKYSASNAHYYTFADSSNAAAATIVDELNEKFFLYYNHASTYVMAPAGKSTAYTGQTADKSYYGTVLFNSWLQRNNSAVSGYTAFARVISLVPKDAGGTAYRYRNFETTFLFRFADSSASVADGGVLLGFRQKSAGKFMTSAADFEQKGGLVFITKTGITVKAGEALTADVLSGNVTATFNTALPQEVRITVRAVGNAVTVKITDRYNDVLYYEDTVDVAYDTTGAIAYATSSRGQNLGDISLIHLDDAGDPIDVDFSTATETEANAPGEKFTFSAKDIEQYENDTYVANGSNAIGMGEVSAAAYTAVTSKFNFYFNHERNYQSVEPYGNAADIKSSGNWELFENRWLRRVTGATAREEMSEYVRLINSMVPKDDYGNELTMTNLIASFDFRFEKTDASASTSTLLFGFRQKAPGKFVNGYGAMNTEQCLVAISPHSMDVAGGTDITKERFYRYSYHGQYTKLNTVYDVLPEEIHVQIKAIGTNCTVTIYDITGTTELFSKTFTVNYTKPGNVAFGVGTINGSYANFSITRLDADAGEMDIGEAESLQNCPWDTVVTPLEDVMDADTATDYDFYYSSAATGTVKESMDVHWALNADGILMRQNDLKEAATDNVAMLHWKGVEQTKTLKNFDVSFKLQFDEKETGTFWVTAGTKQENIGKIVTAPGGTDFVKGQLSVGVAVGGDVTISIGDGESLTIDGPTAGTPTGPHFVRVKVANGIVSVYLDGIQRASRTLDVAVGEGALCFGYSGAKLGIAAVQLTKLDDNGATVDFNSDYVSVQNPAMILVDKNTPYADVEALLPDTLIVTDKNGDETESKVFWDLSALDVTTEGENTVVGYLETTNGIRAEVVIRVGTYDDENTVIYTFTDVGDLEAFDRYYLPETATLNAPAFHVKDTANDNWYINSDGMLNFKENAWLKSLAEVQEGFTLNGVAFQDKYANICNINTGIAVLKDRKYKNFILELDYRNDSEHWNLVGFGAQATGENDVFWTQQNGGYTYTVYPDGAATMRGYSETAGTSDIISHKSKYFQPYSPGNGTHHLKMIVSDGVAYLYLDDFETPYVATIPAEYNEGDGGYIYFATNAVSCRFDNIKIVDLDAKSIQLQNSVSVPMDMTVDREAGEALNLPQTLDMVDTAGCNYTVPVEWQSDDYRSNVSGVYTFSAVPTLANATVASDFNCEVQVENVIGNDFDSDYTVKYYLDHENDLSDFLCHNSVQQTDEQGNLLDEWTADEGELVKVEATDYWDATAKGVSTNYVGAGGSYTMRNKFRSVSSLVLKDLNLVNFRLELDYMHGSNFWYPYVLVGVQDPATYIGTLGFYSDSGESIFKYETVGGGVWCYMEREGRFNIHGAIDILSHNTRFNTDYGDSDFISTYSAGGTHHMTITVVEGLLTMQVDDSAEYYVELSDQAWGGYVGIAGCGNFANFSNFEITALDPYGNEVPLADAERGFAPEGPAEWIVGWVPTDTETGFEWGSKYTR